MPQQKHLSQYSSNIVFKLNNQFIIKEVWPEKNSFSKLFSTGLLNKKFTSLIEKKQKAIFQSFFLEKLAHQKSNKPIEILLKTSSKKNNWFLLQLQKNNQDYIINCININTVKQKTEENNEALENIQPFKELLYHAPVPFVSCTLDFKPTFVNQRFTEIFGYTLGEIKTYKVWLSKFYFKEKNAEAQHHKEFDEILKLSKKSKNAPKKVLERQIFTKNNELKNVRIIFKIFSNQIFGVLHDVTQQQKIEVQLIESERRFKALINNIAIPVSCYDINTLECNFINKPFTKVLGYELAEIGHFTNWYKFIIYNTEEEKYFNGKLWQKAIDKRKNKASKEVALFERNIKCKDGTVKLFEVSFTVNDNLVYAILKDITEQRKAESLLKETQEQFRLLAENMPIAIGSHDFEQNVIFLNKFFIATLGYDYKDLPTLNEWYLHTQPDPLLRKQLHQNWLSIIDNFRKGGITNQPSIEATLKCKDGSFKIFNFLFSVVKEVVYIILVDITEKKNAEKDLLQSHTQLRELASHLQKIREEERKYIAREIHDELGQLITGLKFDISFTKKKIEKAMPELSHRLHETMQLTDKIVRTVRRISTELRPSILDDIGLAAAIEWESKEFTKRTGICCSFTNDAGEIELSVEKKSNLYRIFQESLTNVLRHAKATEVKVHLEIRNDKIALCINDNGKGFSLKQETKTLGLIGMKERALALDGTYNIQASPGAGTKVCVEIPIN